MDNQDYDPRLTGEMRDFMESCRGYYDLIFEDAVNGITTSSNNEELITEAMLVGRGTHAIFGDLHDAVDRLRSFMESSGGDYAMGVEDGMQRAADILETILKRHEEK